MAETQCDIIMPVYNRLDLTKGCLDSIYARTRIPINLILIDNASFAETKDFLEGFRASKDNVRLVRNERNLGWIKAVNQGMALSSSRYVCIMNNDTVVRTDGWLSRMIEVAEMAADIGLVNPSFDTKNETCRTGKPFIEVDFCRGYCILIKRVVVDRIGRLDEAYGAGYYDDDDYSVRAIRAGFKCVKANNVLVEHMRDSTFKTVFGEDNRMALHEKNKALFYSKWGRRLNLFFAIMRIGDRKKVSGLLLSLARRQHRICLWNFADPLRIEHTNIIERRLPKIFPSAIISLRLYINSRKKKARQYDIVFTGDIKMGIGRGYNISRLDLEKDASLISELIEARARA